MPRYSNKFKARVLKALTEGNTYQDTAKRYGVSVGAIKYWKNGSGETPATIQEIQELGPAVQPTKRDLEEELLDSTELTVTLRTENYRLRKLVADTASLLSVE